MFPRRLSTGIAYTPAGALQHRITLLQQNQQRDTNGEFLDPVIFAETWASISILQGRDLERAQQIVSEVSHKVVIRHIEGVKSSMTVQFVDRTFLIQAVEDPDERKVELHLLCLERNDGQPGER